MATLKSLLDLIDRFQPEIQKAFLAAIQDVKDGATIKAIIDNIKAGNINAAIDAIGLDAAALRPLTATIETAYETGGMFTADQFRRPVNGAKFRFDVRNSRAEAWLRDYSSELVTKINTEQLTIIRETMNTGVTLGNNPREIALDLVGRVDPVTGRRVGGVIGLNGPQATALENAKKDLNNLDSNYFNRELRDKRFDSVVQKAIDSGTPLSPEYIDKLSTRYSDNLLKWRGETIARDQALTALNQSEFEATQQLLDTDTVDHKDVKRIWDSAGDDGRTRKTHLKMDDQEVGPDEPFTTPEGYKLMYPGDTSLGAPADETINCRCRVRLKVDWLRKAREAG